MRVQRSLISYQGFALNEGRWILWPVRGVTESYSRA